MGVRTSPSPSTPPPFIPCVRTRLPFKWCRCLSPCHQYGYVRLRDLSNLWIEVESTSDFPKMYKRLRIQGIKALKDFSDYTNMKKKASRACSTHKDEPHNNPGLGSPSGTTRTFVLPSDYFTRNGQILQPCKFPGKVHIVQNEVDERRLVENGEVCQDFQNQDALGLDTESVQRLNALPRITLIQLASKKNAVLWICNQGNFREKLPPYLLSLFHGDALKVRWASDSVLV